MTPQEIIKEIHKLPPRDRQMIKDSIDNGDAHELPNENLTEEEVNRILFAEGIIGNVPDPSKYDDYDDDWEPIEVLGEPLSEMIIRERG